MSYPFLEVDYDGEVFFVRECSTVDDIFSSVLLDSTPIMEEVDGIIADYNHPYRRVVWTDMATDAKIRSSSALADKASEKAIEQLSELNIKVVNLANKLAEHMRERDAHNPAMMYKGKKEPAAPASRNPT